MRLDWQKYRAEFDRLEPTQRHRALAEAERLVQEEGWESDRALLEALGLYATAAEQDFEVDDREADVQVRPASWQIQPRPGAGLAIEDERIEEVRWPRSVHNRRRRGARQDSR